MRALIVESGATRGALAAARALHAADWTVGVATPTARGIASSSRAVSHRHRVPSPGAGLAPFLETVGVVVDDGGYEIVFGAGDAEAIALSAGRAEIEVVVPYASHERVVRAHDKLELAEAAGAAGLGVPRTVEASPAAIDSWSPPYLVKASLHAPVGQDEGPARLEAEFVEERDAASRRASEIRAGGSVPLLQEPIEGSLLALAAVTRRDGTVVAVVSQLADVIRGPVGVSVRARTIETDSELLDRVQRLLSDLGWFGLAQLQFIAPQDGPPRLIDFNGRFYGSLSLASAAGVNLPAIWAALATERPIPPLSEPMTGVRYQWLEGDLRRAWSERRGGLGRDLWRSLRYARGATHSLWSPSDPGPTLRRLRLAAAEGLRRVAGRRSA